MKLRYAAPVAQGWSDSLHSFTHLRPRSSSAAFAQAPNGCETQGAVRQGRGQSAVSRPACPPPRKNACCEPDGTGMYAALAQNASTAASGKLSRYSADQ